MQICLPAQLATPSPVYPGLHMQEYNPGSLVQVAFSWQSCAWLLSDVVHSSISTKKKDIGQQKKKGGRYLGVYEDTIHSSIFKRWTHHKAEIPIKLVLMSYKQVTINRRSKIQTHHWYQLASMGFWGWEQLKENFLSITKSLCPAAVENVTEALDLRDGGRNWWGIILNSF